MELKVEGGTIVGMSPHVHSYQNVLLPVLKEMGIKTHYEHLRPGLFSDCIGEVKISID